MSPDAASSYWLSTLAMRATDVCICVCLKIHADSMSSRLTKVAELTLLLLAQLSATVFSILGDMLSSSATSGEKMFRCAT